MTQIQNMPNYAKDYNYIVATNVKGTYWFWGAYNDRDRANEVALEEGGRVFRNEQQKRGRRAVLDPQLRTARFQHYLNFTVFCAQKDRKNNCNFFPKRG